MINLPDLAMAFLGLSSSLTGVLLAQSDPTGGVISSLLQLGGIGAILIWITFVDIPNRNKAHDGAVKAWQDALVAERISSKEEREAADKRHDAMLAAHKDTLDRFARVTERVADALDKLDLPLEGDHA